MDRKGLRVVVTGATGMVGEGVLHECLMHPSIEEVLVVNRRPLGMSHTKLREIIHSDFFYWDDLADEFAGYDACFFCLGVSSVGMNADEYYKYTYTLTMSMAEMFSRQNPMMVFCYVSGQGTDSSESGRSRWARVKGKTENDLMKLPFRGVYAFRPGFIKPTPGLKHAHKFYRYINWLFPIGRSLFPSGFCTLRELGLAMIVVAEGGYVSSVVEGRDIIMLAGK